jgi:hypothetical protein
LRTEDFFFQNCKSFPGWDVVRKVILEGQHLTWDLQAGV